MTMRSGPQIGGTGRSGMVVCAVLSVLVPASPVAEEMLPRLPFHGVYGGTLGAGSLTGWERNGGENPAVSARVEPDAALVRAGAGARVVHSLAVAGYVPFGLEELRVAEVMAARDVGAFGVSLRWTSMRDRGADASAAAPGEGTAHGAPQGASGRVRMQAAWRPFIARAVSVGTHFDAVYAAARGAQPGTHGGMRAPEAAVGVLWRPASWLGAGAAATGRADDGLRAAAVRIGADAGFPPGAYGARGSARVAVEHHRETRTDGSGMAASWRLGGIYRPHPLLSVQAGWESASGQVALGIRFGAGPLAVSSALRRHALLGGTSVQSLEWRSRTER